MFKQKQSSHYETAVPRMPALRLNWGTLSARTWEPQLTSRNRGAAVGEHGALASRALSRGRPGQAIRHAAWAPARRMLTGLGHNVPYLQRERISWKFSTHTAGGFDMGTSRRRRCGYVWSLSA